MIPYGEWAPDQQNTLSPDLEVAIGCFPSEAGYTSMPSPGGSGVALTGTPLGLARYERRDSTEVILYGSDADLHVIVGGTRFDSGLGLTGTVHLWAFEQWGQSIYATNRNKGTYRLDDIDTDTTFSTITAPSARAMSRIDDFLLFGNLRDVDSSDQPYRLRWSAFNNPDGTYTTDLATQAGFQDMPAKYGPIRGISGGVQGLILQREGVHRIDYVGGSTVWDIALLAGSVGCVAPQSVVRVDNLHFWLGEQGFARSDGQSVRLISDQKLWKWMQDVADTSLLRDTKGAIDWDRNCIVWQVDLAFPLNVAQIVYHWALDRWSYATQDLTWVVGTDGVTKSFRGLSCITSSLSLEKLNGTPISATLQTHFFEPSPDARTFLSGIRPIIENANENDEIDVLYKDSLGATASRYGRAAIGSLGYAPTVVDARYIAVEHLVPAGADWDKAQGFHMDAQRSGQT